MCHNIVSFLDWLYKFVLLDKRNYTNFPVIAEPSVATKEETCCSVLEEPTLSQAARLREKCRSRHNFAWRLMPFYFQPEEMAGKTVRGSKTKPAINQQSLEKLRLKVNDVCFVPKTQEPEEWRRCELAIDKGLRCSKFPNVWILFAALHMNYDSLG